MAPASKPHSASQDKLTASRSLEPVGKSLPVVVHGSGNAAPDASRIHPSTERALIIRDKAGAPIIPGKISGQDKLALLADQLMTNAVRPRLDMEELLRIADSQLWLHLSEISNLKDPLFFYDDIMTAIESRFESLPDRNGQKPDIVSNSRWIASVIGSRVHNLYLLAACWRIVKQVIKELNAMHLDPSEAREQLARNIKLRDKYILLYDVVSTLARLGQQRMANIAAATPHYAGYFHLRNITTNIGEAEAQLEFNRQNSDLRQLRQAHKSFIDAIVLEIALPNSQYPPHVLMTLLRDAVDECKKEEVRFSQALWDAIGDLSMATRALDMIEGPLLDEQGDAWLRNSALSREYIELLKMQDLSQQVVNNSASWSACFHRLIDTKDKACLDLLWRTINESYRKFTGNNPEASWSLQKESQRSPQWSYALNADIDDSEDLDRALVVRPPAESKVNRGADRLRLTSAARSDDEDDEIPALMSLSDFSEEANIDASGQPYDNSGDYESDYDENEDEIYQEDLREAQNQLLDMILDPDPELLELEKKSSNPFVKMFANLRDRFFAANPTLRLNERSRRPDRHVFFGAAQVVGTGVDQPTGPSKPQEVAEDVEDEDDVHPSKRKKKKKKKKKKLSQDQELAEELNELENEESRDLPTESSTAPFRTVTPDRSIPLVKPVESPQSRISSPEQASSTRKPRPALNKPNKPNKLLEEFSYSRISLPSPETAQSARSYLQAENLVSEKSKIKSRPAFPSKFFNISGEDKELKKGKDKDDKEDGSKTGNILKRIKKINLPKKAGELMHRLIGSADGKTHAKKTMKWDDFVKVMRAMGFTYEPSTAGSSVRFDPPHTGDPSVTFHKPHPDSTLQRHHLREFGKKLTRTYGWSEQMFSTFGIEEDEVD